MTSAPAKRVLLLYSTRDGQTRKIADTVALQMSEAGVEAHIADLQDSAVPSPEHFDGVLIAASIRYGKFNPALSKFTTHYAPQLSAMTTAFISVNLTARKPDKNTPETNVYTRKFLEGSSWQPTECLVAAGALRYPRYGFFDKLMIRLIMKMTGGPTDPSTDEEYTDWQQLSSFTQRFIDRLNA